MRPAGRVLHSQPRFHPGAGFAPERMTRDELLHGGRIETEDDRPPGDHPGLVRRDGSGWFPWAHSAWSAEPIIWKFKAGESLRYTMVQEIIQETKAGAGGEVDHEPDRRPALEHQERLDRRRGRDEPDDRPGAIQGRRSGASFDFDSQAEKAPEGPIASQLTPMLRALVGAEFTLKMNPRGEMSEVKVPQKLTESLRQAGPAAAAGGMFSEEGLKNLIAQMPLTFPEGGLEREVMGPSVPLRDTQYWHHGTEQKVHLPGAPIPVPASVGRFLLDTSVKLEPEAKSNVAVKISAHEGKGEFSFDPQAGRIVSSHVDDRLTMSLSVAQQSIEQTTKTITTMTLARDGGAK